MAIGNRGQGALALGAVAAAMAIGASGARAEALTHWELIGSDSEGAVAIYAEQGSYARILDRGEPSLRMVVKMLGSSGQDAYQQLIFPETLCAKGSGSMDRYTLDGLTYLGATPAARARGPKGKGARHANPDDMAADAMCSAYEASLPAPVAAGSALAAADKGSAPSTDSAPAKPSFFDRVKAVFK